MSGIVNGVSAMRYIQGHIETLGYVPRVSQCADVLGLPLQVVNRTFAELRKAGLARETSEGHCPYPLIDLPIPRDPSGHPLFFVGVQ